jgi:hypothetical protein
MSGDIIQLAKDNLNKKKQIELQGKIDQITSKKPTKRKPSKKQIRLDDTQFLNEFIIFCRELDPKKWPDQESTLIQLQKYKKKQRLTSVLRLTQFFIDSRK